MSEVQIFTSYHAKAKALNEMGFCVIAISTSIPSYANPGFYNCQFPPLTPRKEMLKMTREKYYEQFDQILSRHTPDGIYKLLSKRAIEAGKDKVALVCYEKDCNECHRSYVAKWFAGVGIEVKEVEFEQPKKEPEKPQNNQLNLF